MYIARPEQPLKDHLQGVADIASEYAKKLNLGNAGGLTGLLHDLGKYSEAFQEYIKEAGLREADRDDE